VITTTKSKNHSIKNLSAKGLFSRKNIITAVAVLVPLIIIIGLIHTYAVNVPVTDQYEMVTLFQKLDNHTLSFFNLWQQHNEHRVLFPNIYLLTLAVLTHWSIIDEIISNVVVSVIGFIAVLLIIKRTKFSYLTGALVAITASFLFFSPVQWENWLWGWQIEWFMCSTGVLWSIYHLSKVKRESNRNLFYGICFAVFASYCLASGPLVWPAGIACLYLINASRRQYTIWSITGLITIFLYYYHYKTPAGSPSTTVFLHQPVNFVKYFLTYLGRPISDQTYAAALAGTVMFLIFIMCLLVFIKHKTLRQKYAPWITISIYALLTAAATTVGRMGFGVQGVMQSRYTAFSLLFIISTVVIGAGLLAEKKLILRDSIKQSYVVMCLSVFTAIIVLSSYNNGLPGMKQQSSLYHYIYTCSRVANPTQACLYQIYFPSTQTALVRLNYLKQKHYGGY
jgi:hypothetical protein